MEAKLENAFAQLWSDDRPLLSDHGIAVAQDLQRRYEIRLPDDFNSYLSQASPSIDWIHDSGIIWWAPERIRNIDDECGPEILGTQLNPSLRDETHRYLVFADFMDWCGYAYAICCSDGQDRGKVAMIGVSPARFVAASFLSFVMLTASDSLRLHSPGGDGFTDLV